MKVMKMMKMMIAHLLIIKIMNYLSKMVIFHFANCEMTRGHDKNDGYVQLDLGECLKGKVHHK